ncbi:MAG TPA: hypothetical protein VKM72_03610, partial [Thermoanaerobaculia bacterium]|nr:hypothetical protein [Thermoanaerobaculia bacterium]
GVIQLLEKVSVDLAKLRLFPTSVNQDVPTDFFLRSPVDVEANVTQADDDLLMLLDREIVIVSNQQRHKFLRLRAGDNPFALAISNAKSFHNNHDWSVTEGWNYELRLGLPDGTEHVFKDEGEKNPFKEGPHHGKVFVVARANLFVHPETAKVSVKNPEPKVWEDETPIFAKDQAILYEKSVTELPIDLDEIISDAFHLNGFLAPVVLQILKTGTFLGATIADPSKTFVLVLGNRAIQDLVDFCMNEQKEDRMRDLKASLAAVLARNPRPFDIFDQNLNTALRQEAERRGRTDIPLDQIRVWTAVDDRSKS